jgi:hypothetical protein
VRFRAVDGDVTRTQYEELQTSIGFVREDAPLVKSILVQEDGLREPIGLIRSARSKCVLGDSRTRETCPIWLLSLTPAISQLIIPSNRSASSLSRSPFSAPSAGQREMLHPPIEKTRFDNRRGRKQSKRDSTDSTITPGDCRFSGFLGR